MAVVTAKDEIQGKTKNCKLTCLFMGYFIDYGNDICCMLNFNTQKSFKPDL
jgi:hypothetical protein